MLPPCSDRPTMQGLAYTLCHRHGLYCVVWLCSNSNIVDRLFEGHVQEVPKGRLQEAITKYALCAFENHNVADAKLFATENHMHCTACYQSLSLLLAFTAPAPLFAHSKICTASFNLHTLWCLEASGCWRNCLKQLNVGLACFSAMHSAD